MALQVDGYAVYSSFVKNLKSAYAETIRAEEGEEAAQEFLHDVECLIA